MRNMPIWLGRFAIVLLAMSAAATLSTLVAMAVDEGQYRTADGLAIYLGVVPAEIVKGPPPHSTERPLHGQIPKGPHQYHVVVAIFDGVTGVRVSDATVTAQVSGLGLSGPIRKLDPMEIANTITYGAFFNLPGPDLYTVRLTVERPGKTRPVLAELKYDHRRK